MNRNESVLNCLEELAGRQEENYKSTSSTKEALIIRYLICELFYSNIQKSLEPKI